MGTDVVVLCLCRIACVCVYIRTYMHVRWLLLDCSLIKMLYWMCNNASGQPLTGRQLEHAIKRNFGGMESEKLNPWEEFQKQIGNMESRVEKSEEVC